MICPCNLAWDISQPVTPAFAFSVASQKIATRKKIQWTTIEKKMNGKTTNKDCFYVTYLKGIKKSPHFMHIYVFDQGFHSRMIFQAKMCHISI